MISHAWNRTMAMINYAKVLGDNFVIDCTPLVQTIRLQEIDQTLEGMGYTVEFFDTPSKTECVEISWEKDVECLNLPL